MGAAQVAQNQKQAEGLNEDDSDDDEEYEEGAQDDDGADDEICAADKGAEAVEAARRGDLFGAVVGTALCEALAFTNHCCLPNCAIDFATAGQAEARGPGLWV